MTVSKAVARQLARQLSEAASVVTATYRHVRELMCAHVTTFTMDIITDKVEAKQLMMEQRYNIVPGIIVTENCGTVNEEKDVCS